MAKRNIADLYRDVIKKHEREPVHFQKIEDAEHVIEAYNPLCGDQFQLFLAIENGVISAAHFHGYGCAISKASTSVLMKKMQGMTLEEVSTLCQHFQTIVTAETDEPDEELSAFAAARQFPERLTCATLSWEALENFLSTHHP
jgi:nitrogen fixation NifU-like protein